MGHKMSYFRCSCKEKAKIFTKQFLCIEPTTIGHSLKNTLEKMKSSKISLVRFFFSSKNYFQPLFSSLVDDFSICQKKILSPRMVKNSLINLDAQLEI